MIIQYFHWYLSHEDHLWQKLTDDVPNLKRLGVTSVWMPPAYKGSKGIEDSGYGVYDLYDMGEFDQKDTIPTKYGTEAEYASAIKELNKYKIDVIADVVLNHKLGADGTETLMASSINPERRTIVEGFHDIEAWSIFNFPGRNSIYSDFKWNHTHFTSVDYDNLRQEEGLFLFKDKVWSENIDLELENYDYLMGADVDFYNPEVVDEYHQWAKFYLEKYSIQGMRLDAVKHIDFDFFYGWLAKIREKQDLLVVGEYWSSELSTILNYLIESEYAMSLFDVPFHFNLERASIEKEQYDLRTLFIGTLVQNLPHHAVTFVDNHDTQKGQSLESYIEPWFRESANALILLREEGVPCVFYLDYLDPQIQKIMQLRNHMQEDRYDMFDDAHCIGWSYTSDPGLCVLISNKESVVKKMFVGKKHSDKVFKDALGNCNQEVLIDQKGNGMFKVEGQSLSVYTVEGEIDEIIL